MGAGARVAAVLAAFFAGMAVQSAYLPLWFADRGLSAAEIGLILGVATLARIGLLPAGGWVADRLGQRPMLVGSAALAGLCALLLPVLRGPAALLPAVALMLASAALLSPLADAISLALAAVRRLDYGRTRAWGSLSYMAATAAAGSLLAWAGTGAVPWLLAAAYGLASAFGLLLPPAGRGPRIVPPGDAPLRSTAFRWALLASAAIQGSHAAYYSFAPLLWRGMGIGDGTIGLILAGPLVAEVALFWWGRPLVERLGPARLTAVAALAAVVRWTATAFLHDPLAIGAVQMLHAATFGLQHLSAMLVLRRLPPGRAATAQALLSALGVGLPTGLLVWAAGLLVASLGPMVFLAMAGVAALALLAVPGLNGWDRPTAPPPA